MSNRHIILPRSGFRAISTQEREALLSMPSAFSTQAPRRATFAGLFGTQISPIPETNFNVIDSVHEDGPKLVELNDVEVAALNAPGSPVRTFPEVVYDLPAPVAAPTAAMPMAAIPTTFTILCQDSVAGDPLPGCKVIAFDNFAARTGAQGQTGPDGRLTLTIGANVIERLYVYSQPSHWGAFRSGLHITSGATTVITIAPVSLSDVDAVRQYYGASMFDQNAGITVGVLDTGVGPHNNINLLSGRNTVTGEPRAQFEDWLGHGTHVAGLIGSNGTPPTGLRGVAPGVGIRAYRVFGRDSRATNYAILKALIVAGDERCDIVNLSLGGGPADPIVSEAITDARNQGMLVVIAAGNDSRNPVAYPAKYTGATAVSAMGCEGTYPVGSISEADVLRPPVSSADAREFIAGFSNIGPEIALTAPGVGVLSTLPNNAHGPMSGTSMAAPVAVGAAASLLSQNADIYSMPRDNLRAAMIERMLQISCIRRGFGPNCEGYGLPDPNLV